MPKNATIQHADNKLRKTSLSTMSDIHTLLTEAGATSDEVKAMSAVISGTSVRKACLAYGLNVPKEKTANTVNRVRARFATIMLDMLKNIAAPVAAIAAAVKDAENETERQAKIVKKLAAWEENGGHGRKPGEGNRPKAEIALEKAHSETRRLARENLSIPANGRIAPEMQEKYVREFLDLYTKALKEIGKKYADLNLDADKIEKMVNRGIKDLKVSAKAQKAVNANSQKPKSQKVKAKKVKSQKAKAEPKNEPETVVPSTETASEPVQA
jgi:hypothetical protein